MIMVDCKTCILFKKCEHISVVDDILCEYEEVEDRIDMYDDIFNGIFTLVCKKYKCVKNEEESEE